MSINQPGMHGEPSGMHGEPSGMHGEPSGMHGEPSGIIWRTIRNNMANHQE